LFTRFSLHFFALFLALFFAFFLALVMEPTTPKAPIHAVTEAVKRVEIVIDTLEAPKILRLLSNIGVSGYSVVKDVTGKGGRGTRAGDELTDVFKNSYILIACSPDESSRIADAILPTLKRFGGICLISDALVVKH
jgi:nitrogen regulatory protein PII